MKGSIDSFGKRIFQMRITNKWYRSLFSRMLCTFFTHDRSKLNQIKLHLKGTTLHQLGLGNIVENTHGQIHQLTGNIAEQIQSPKASRAVGSAIGDNPVAF